MKSLNECMDEYTKQIKKGYIKTAYRGLMEYLLGLRTHFNNNYPDYFVSGNIYYGYMDMSYFSVVPKSLKSKKLKIAIVFIHEKAGFEIWLAAVNKQIQNKYWRLFIESGWSKYRIPSTTKGFDSIVEHDLVNNPNFDNLNMLTRKIENGTLEFVKDIEVFLSKHSD